MAERIGVGVVGLGFMGQTHVRAYEAAAAAGLPCELVAVCDQSEERLRGEGEAGGNLQTGASGRVFDPQSVRGYKELDEFLADPRLSLVSVCTYTDSHIEVASRALRAGKHVLVEKPVALSSIEVRRLAFEAEESGRLCMPAMCMRFWNGWDWVREKIRSGAYGSVKSAQFQRMGAGPPWGAAFYRDFSRSGGALWDLHIHDADFVYWCFGKPESVAGSGTLEHLTTLYRFADGPRHVSAEGAWDLPPSAGFRMKYLVTFERAAVEFDLAQGVTVWQEGEPERVRFDGMTAYEREIRYFVEAAARGEGARRATMDDAIAVAEMLEAERRSMESGEPVAL